MIPMVRLYKVFALSAKTYMGLQLKDRLQAAEPKQHLGNMV